MIPHEALLASAYCCVLAGVFLFVLQVAVVPPAPRPTLGARGLARSRAMIRAGLFPLAEPCIRAVAAWLPIGSSNRLWQRLDQVLDRSGNYLGLSGQELIASCTLAGAAVGSISFAILHAFEIPVGLSVIGASLGTLAPWLRVVAVARKRARSVDQQLPSAVELAAMCMGAGLDFPGSLRQIIDSAAEPDEPIFEEFAQILRELELGYTRRRALQGFASRVPTAAVRELVNSVAQAEEKGTPLASVLTIQSQTQRLRRSVAAEQGASAAALMLLGPMTLIFVCVIALLLGPVVVRFMTGGLGPV